MSLDKAKLHNSLAQVFQQGPCAIAVSGGGDSLALALLCHQLGFKFHVLHFNHNLRPEAAAEAEWLKTFFKKLEVPFHTASWQMIEAPDAGRLQAEAREVRYAFFSAKCQELALSTVLLGHTADDIAETFLMRLFYGSGPQGLRAMDATQTLPSGLKLYRPLLDVRRDDLRAYLAEETCPWLEDPSNANAQFVRVRARYWLQKLNLTTEICQLSQSLAALNDALSRLESGYIIQQNESCAALDVALLQTPAFLQERVLKHVITNLTGAYPPRTKQLARLVEHLSQSDKNYEVGHLSWQRQAGIIQVQRVSA